MLGCGQKNERHQPAVNKEKPAINEHKKPDDGFIHLKKKLEESAEAQRQLLAQKHELEQQLLATQEKSNHNNREGANLTKRSAKWPIKTDQKSTESELEKNLTFQKKLNNQ